MDIQWKILSMGAVVLVLLAAVPAAAQEQTGAVEGRVTDISGAPLPGVMVAASGPRLAGGARVTTNGKGRYRFPALPPGGYEITATLEGFAPTKVPQFRLNLGDLLQINFSMELATVEDTIHVTSEAPLIEITQSATAESISDELIDKLPRGRDFTSVVTQAAHAADEEGAGGISIDGATGSENRFIVDGIDTTFLISGTSGKQVVTDFVEEVQVKASGYNAEYGGSTGGVISVITKSGGNNFHGDVGAYLRERDWGGDVRPTLRRDPRDSTRPQRPVFPEDDDQRLEPGFTLGGPILRDRLWFFAAYSPLFRDRNRTVTFDDPTTPALDAGETRTFSRQDDTDYGTFNLSGAITDSVAFKATYNISDSERDNLLPGVGDAQNPSTSGNTDPEDFNTDSIRPNESFSGSFDWVASPRLFVNAVAGHFEYDTQDTGFSNDIWINFIGSPTDASASVPPGLIRPNGFSTPSNSGNVLDLLERDQARLSATYFLDEFGGEHTFKAGYQFEEIGNQVLDGYSNTRILFYWNRSVTSPAGESLRGTFGYYRPIVIATDGDVSANNNALFVQDSWTLAGGKLTFNLGVRAEEEEIPSFATREDIPPIALDFSYSDKIAPRFGFAYDVKGDGKWKVYGSWGTFYDTMKLALSRGLFGGQKWIDHFVALDTLDWQSIVQSCRVTQNRIDADSLGGCPGNLLFKLDRRSASNDPNDFRIDPNLEPYESQELTIGAQHQLGRDMSVGIRYVHKELETAIEDVGVLDPVRQAEIFFISNPGRGIAENILGPDFPALPEAVREYDGLELDFRKRYSNNWALHLTYLYSKLYGNYAGLASSDEISNTSGLARTAPNVERYFDSLISSFDANGNLVFGRLSTDRPHVFKGQLIYDTPWGTTVGVNQFLGSGTPISTEYDGPAGNPFFPFGRGDLGRTPTRTQTDLYLAHPFKLGNRFELELSLNVLNLFDEDTVQVVWNSALDQALPLSDEQFFAGFDVAQVIADNNIPFDPRFGLPSVFQEPREVRVAARLRF